MNTRPWLLLVLLLVLLLLPLAPAHSDSSATSYAAIARALETKTLSCNFDRAPLAEAVQYVRQVAQVNVVIDSSALEDQPDLTVTLKLRKARVADALTLMLELNGLTYLIRDGVVFVTTPDAARSRPTITRVYDVRGLQISLEDFPGSLDDLAGLLTRRAPSKGPVADEDEREPKREQLSIERLIELIQSQIAPESWDLEGTSIDAIGGSLVVRNTRQVHQQLALFLRDLQQFATITIRVDAWLLPSDGGALGTGGKPVPLAQWRKTLAEQSEPVEHVSATAYNSQRVGLHGGAVVPFAESGVTGDLRTGLMLDVRPTYSPRAKAVWLELRFAHSALDGQKQLSLYRFRSHALIPEGSAIVVAGARYGLPGKTLVLAASVRSSGGARSERSQGDARVAAIRAELARHKVSLDLADASLQQALTVVGKDLPVDLVVDPAVLAERSADELKVTLRVRDLAVDSVLKLMLDLKALGFVIRNGAVVITTRKRAIFRGETRVYDVRDLVSRIPDFAESFGPLQRRAADIDEDPMSEDRLLMLINDNVHPDSWDGENTIQSMYGSLIVRNSPAVHAAIERLLQMLRQVSSTTVAVEALALRDPHSALEKRGLTDQVVSGEALDDFLAQAVASKQVTIAGRAVMHGFNTQQFGMFVGRQFVAEGAGGEVRVEERGLKLDVRPVLALGGRDVTLTVRSEASGSDQVQRFATTVHFPVDGAVILGGARRSGVVLVLRVTPLK